MHSRRQTNTLGLSDTRTTWGIASLQLHCQTALLACICKTPIGSDYGMCGWVERHWHQL